MAMEQQQGWALAADTGIYTAARGADFFSLKLSFKGCEQISISTKRLSANIALSRR
jgi:hypothetical protein